MTSRPVTEISALLSASISTKAGSVGTSESSAKFTDVLNNTSKEPQKNTSENVQSSTKKAPIATESSAVKKQIIQDKEKPETDSVTSVDEKIQEAAEEIVETIKDTLNVSEEDIEAAMETLGLVMTDLFNTENVISIVTELTGTTDMMMLVTDETLSTDLKDILNAVATVTDGLLEELNMTQEEFELVLEEMPTTDVHREQTEQTEVTESSQTEQKSGEEAVLMNETEETTQEQAPKVIVVKEDATSNTKEGLSTEETVETSVKVEEIVSTDEQSSPEKDQSQNGQNLMGNEQGFGRQLFEIPTVVPESTSFTATANTEQILQQIAEQIKLTIKPDMTSMEMQLNPASLGRVGLQIEQKAGSITAQFTAQNEAVKTAIESQIVQLRENLENQGIKVDSVEVTIASHEFERNLQQDNSGNGEKKEESGRVVRKRLNLNAGDDFEEEELSEEEELARDIMIESGNSVDYIA